MAAKESILTPETPKIQYYSGIHKISSNLAKLWCFLCFGVQNGAWRGHRVWTSYSNAKLMISASPGTQNGHFPPQTPKITISGDLHENYIK